MNDPRNPIEEIASDPITERAKLITPHKEALQRMMGDLKSHVDNDDVVGLFGSLVFSNGRVAKISGGTYPTIPTIGGMLLSIIELCLDSNEMEKMLQIHIDKRIDAYFQSQETMKKAEDVQPEDSK